MSVSLFAVTADLPKLYYNKLRWKSLLRTLAASESHFTNVNKPANGINRLVFRTSRESGSPTDPSVEWRGGNGG